MAGRVKEAWGGLAVGLALLAAMPAMAATMEDLRACLRGEPETRMAPCTAALNLDLSADARARVLALRADALVAREEPGDLDAAIGDFDASLRLARSEDIAAQRALARFLRGNFGAGLADRAFGGDQAGVLQVLDDAIRAAPRDPDLLWTRSVIRRMNGDGRGADADNAAASRLWRGVR